MCTVTVYEYICVSAPFNLKKAKVKTEYLYVYTYKLTPRYVFARQESQISWEALKAQRRNVFEESDEHEKHLKEY